MKHFLMNDGSISSYPDSCVNFDDDHPVGSAKELTETEYQEALDKQTPKPRDYRAKRRAEFPEWHELAEAVTEKELGKPEKMIEYLAKIAAVKAKYPKP